RENQRMVAKAFVLRQRRKPRLPFAELCVVSRTRQPLRQVELSQQTHVVDYCGRGPGGMRAMRALRRRVRHCIQQHLADRQMPITFVFAFDDRPRRLGRRRLAQHLLPQWSEFLVGTSLRVVELVWRLPRQSVRSEERRVGKEWRCRWWVES